MTGSPGWQRIELGPAGRGLLRAETGDVAVFVVDDAAYAVANACPHAGNPLIEGDVLGTTLVCAFHAWRFDSGRARASPATSPSGRTRASFATAPRGWSCL